MISYKDQTFCSAQCKKFHCHINYTDEIHEAAKRWWPHDPENVPVAFSDFSSTCKEFMK